MKNKTRRRKIMHDKIDEYDNETADHGSIKPKKSLGKLRQAQKTKPRSPDAIGTLSLQRHTFMEIGRQFDEAGGEELICNIAGWENQDQRGEYLSIEISPRFVPRQRKRSNFLHFIRGDDEDE